MTSAAPLAFDDLLSFAQLLADRSAEAILPYFRQRIDVENKATGRDFDPVTAADRAAEEVISQLVEEAWPDHGLIGEEFGSRAETARYRWIVDPIDGTRSFITGSPMWGTLIGLMDGREPVLGIMNQPYTGERFWSDRQGAFIRSVDGSTRPIRTRACPRLDEAILMTTHPEMFAAGSETEAFARVRDEARMTRYGGDCYSYCLLASGFVDVIIEVGLKTFDIVALIPIVERAGGRITNWEGKPAHEGGRVVVTGDPKLHDEVLELINR